MRLGSGIAKYVPLIGGVSLILLVLLNQNGIAKEAIAQIAWVRSKLGEVDPVPGPRKRRRGEAASVRGRRARTGARRSRCAT